MSISEWSWISTLLGSASSGLVGRVLCHPFDTCKARLQAPANFEGERTLWSIMKMTFQQEGMKGFYRGIGGVLIVSIPGTCVYLSTYEICKKYLSTVPYISNSPFTIYLTSGMVSEAVCCILFVPIDVIKNRLQLQRIDASGRLIAYPGQPLYKHTLDAFVKISQKDGVQGLYKGYGMTLLSFGPFSALYFLLYEESKRVTSEVFRKDKDALPLSYSLPCAVFSGSLSAFVTSPLDLVKLRIQVSQASDGVVHLGSPPVASASASSMQIMSAVFAQSGLRGLYRGALARVLFHAPSTALTVALFEDFRRWWDKVLS